MLSRDQFFHGTTHAIKDGVVRPADDADKNVSEYSMGDPGFMSEGDHAFAIRNDEGYAWRAANTFHPSLRRSRVYEVEPAPDMKPGPWNAQNPDWLSHVELDHPEYPPDKDDIHEAIVHQSQDEWASQEGFKVKKRIDIMPGHQGTFPNISWGRFSERPYNQGINHPTDEMVRHGHEGLEKIQSRAIKDNEAFNAQKPSLREPRRTGRSLRAFMEGKPEEPPRLATLF